MAHSDHVFVFFIFTGASGALFLSKGKISFAFTELRTVTFLGRCSDTSVVLLSPEFVSWRATATEVEGFDEDATGFDEDAMGWEAEGWEAEGWEAEGRMGFIIWWGI